MKITEKMYLLAKEIVKEYEGLQKEPKTEKKQINDYTTSVIECYEECVKEFPADLKPKDEKSQVKWLDVIDKLNRLDNLQFSDISLIVKTVRRDKFWSKNFLTLRKLRRKNNDGVPYWKVFREKFKKEQSKSEQYKSAYEQAKETLGL